ncbi:hypothetical protein CLV63_106188 [Murinocardiopsis flavida]|uniref:Uncharacterized protein n=1 Tax=Murinocardiopsis flavida TaxID=645275 RepID=A0A2P8DLN6_9ACTN|nr:hypothetical protein [Murinocardiopsis flavida]PSK98140.1 hypothetical protein CLV63_106188 [Murinocardiopsis flavida]
MSDEERHRAAAHVQWQKQGAWLVLWGAYTRRFWAFACWPVPEGGEVVSAPTVGELYTRMRDSERRHDFMTWRYGRR